jgi:N6-adenosine-specific RNA methylase IME4
MAMKKPRKAPESEAAKDMRHVLAGQKFATILADPPWRFQNSTGKVAPEHRRLSRYGTMTLEDICALPVHEVAAPISHLYLWVPNALLPEGLAVMKAWGFLYKGNLVWSKVRKDGEPDGRGVGFYFRNTTELLLFGIRGKGSAARTLQPGRSQVNLIATRKREHSRKPDEFYPVIEGCSWVPRLEMFARGVREGWTVWGNQAADDYEPTWDTYSHNSATERRRQSAAAATVAEVAD